MTTVKAKRYLCTECGSSNVYQDAWVALNPENDDIAFDDHHCEDCQGECSVILTDVEITS